MKKETKIALSVAKILLAIILFLCLISLSSGCAAPTASTIMEVKSNLDAERVVAGMIYAQDFIIDENYHITFVRTVDCKSIHIAGDSIHYTTTDQMGTPYFMWVCYPQITLDSRTTVICIEEDASGTWTVIAVCRRDTNECLQEFGGTYGTEQNDW